MERRLLYVGLEVKCGTARGRDPSQNREQDPAHARALAMLQGRHRG